jgi:hypothetical protein
MKPSDYVALTVHEISCEGEASHEAFTQFVVLRRRDWDEADYDTLRTSQLVAYARMHLPGLAPSEARELR